jgi:secreted PhoX family phosphatase
MTCRYRCGNACAHAAPNESGNPYFGDISRRTLFRAGAAGALVLTAGTAAPAVAAPGGDPAGGGALTFTPVPPNVLDRVLVPDGYDSAVVIRWGDPILPGAPAFDVHRQTAQRQERQFGFNNDFIGVLPLGRDRALLVVNHEYTNEELMFPGFTTFEALTVEQIRVSMAAHGMSVVEIERAGRTGRWRPVRGPRLPYNRRFTMLSTPFRFDGPVAGSDWLRTAADPAGRTAIGTLNNCAGGVTPWGTVLSGEENFNQYFVGGDQAPEELKPRLARYGVTVSTRYPADTRRWERAQERFDLARHPHEAHRFGWIVEVDPHEPGSTPRKHTAMGRFKHEGANVIVSRRGNVAAYMGDDERFEYLYKFVSDGRYRPDDRRHNLTLLSSGTLYVARFTGDSPPTEIDGTGTLPSDRAFDGTGRWLRLASGNRSHVPGMSVEEVLTFARQAADAVGATRMDRPEDVQPSPHTGKIYAALTNNVLRGTGAHPGVDEANPRRENRHGQILEITEDGGDHTGTTFTWSLPIVCGDPNDPATYFAGYDKSAVSPISCPDNVAFDGTGNLWIATDGNALGSNDGLFATAIEGPERGHLKQFLTVPPGAETCGPFLTGDGRSVFVAVQHPGEIDGATLDDPASRWPDGDYAKPAVTVTWRRDGGRVGS